MVEKSSFWVHAREVQDEADDRFDPAFASNLLLEVAQEQSLDHLLKTLVRRILARPAIVRVRMWLLEKGDICSTCVRRAECPDQGRCLHAVAGGSNLIAGTEEEYLRVADRFVRIPLGVGLVGRVAATGEQVVLDDLDQDPGELEHAAWLKAEQVRGFNAVPVSFKGEILGVVAVFCRRNIPEAARVWARLFADHIAGAIANARAFEEIQRLKGLLEQQNAYLQEEVVQAKAFGDLVGHSAALRQVVSQIELVAPTDATVLVLGETGTGKELVAHEIHRRSHRQDKPIVRVNCASIPRDLYESEFFGHAKGAFTGAIKERAGRFEAAEGGTLFLDEIGEVPLELQSKLLRVLQEKQYERVGEDRTRRADVRLICATNRDLKQEMAAGRFREDLYYRLNVFPIHVAALRERKEDIPLLARHFMERAVKELRCARPRLTRAGVLALQHYDWPGNVRELRNVVERGVIVARGGTLTFDLPVGHSPAAGPLPPGEVQDSDTDFLTESQMQQRVRENLVAALETTGWKIKGAGGAAELLGIKPTTLISRMKKMGLVRPR
jgi:transcriptional regulator with GAF, ATPase, and Fis domain